jgi:hypothetical protein
VLAKQAAERAERQEDGDWDCPECGQQGNFASRAYCRSCNAPNPNPVTPRRQAAPRDQADGDSDWNCDVCGQSNFASRAYCRSCNAPNPNPVAARGGYDRGGRERREYAPREQREYVAKEGDWTCRECGDVNYAFRTECRKCRAPKA